MINRQFRCDGGALARFNGDLPAYGGQLGRVQLWLFEQLAQLGELRAGAALRVLAIHAGELVVCSTRSPSDVTFARLLICASPTSVVVKST